MPEASNRYPNLPFLRGGGNMGELIRSIDWSVNPLGTPDQWPVALRQTVSMMLTTVFPILICWGEEYIQLYNDAFRPINGEDKHPHAVGGSAKDTYREIWHQIGPMFAGVMKGETVGFPNFMVLLERSGQPEECYFDFSYSPITMEDGQAGGILVICMETTEKIRAVKAMEVQQQNLRNVVRQAPVGMCIVRGNPLMVDEINDLFLEIVGKDRDAFLSVPYWEIPEAAQIYQPLTARVPDSGETYKAEEQEIHLVRGGVPETVFVDFVYEPILDSEGNSEAFMIVAIDVSEKVKARRKVEETGEEIQATNEELAMANKELVVSEARFRNLILQAPFAICIIRANDLMVMEVNQGYLELIGRKRDEIFGKTIWEVVTEAAESYAPVLQSVVDTGIPFFAKEHEVVLVRSGVPETVFLDFVYEPVIDPRGIVISITVVAIDVTDKVLARQRIEHIEERLRLAVEAAEIGTFDFNNETGELVYSPRFAEIFDVPMGLPRGEVLLRYHPDDAHLSDQAHEQARTTGKIYFEARLLLPDRSVRWIRSQGNVYFDEMGSRTRTIGTVLDITEQKRLQQQKDDFISIASHELKTPITSLKASLQLLERMRQQPTDKLSKLIEQSTRSMHKISDLVDDLLNVSKMNQGHMALDKTQFKVADMLQGCCMHVRQDGKHELIFSGDKELKIVADEHRIEQVVVNFVNNAVKYAPDSAQIVLKAERLGDRARVSVADTGPGIPPEKLPHLFDRYFRADQTGGQVSGLGLGLYICAEIIERHEGKIGVDSILGKGSTFWFEIPL